MKPGNPRILAIKGGSSSIKFALFEAGGDARTSNSSGVLVCFSEMPPFHQVIPFLRVSKNDPFFGTRLRSHQTTAVRILGRKQHPLTEKYP